MSSAMQERRLSRATLPVDSPSLRERAPPASSPVGSPSLLGPAEAPLLPPEDEESDDSWEDAVVAMAQPPTRKRGIDADVPSPSLRSGTGALPAPMPVESHDPLSPSLFEGVPTKPPPPPGMRKVRIKERVVTFKRAACKRPSRAARPSEPSPRAKDTCKRIIAQRESELKGAGRTRLMADDYQKYRASSSSGGKGPSVVAAMEAEQSRMNHIAQLKAKTVETHNNEASWLLWGNTAEQSYDRLAESALRSNSVNSSITKRKETQGAAYRTSRAARAPTARPPVSLPAPA